MKFGILDSGGHSERWVREKLVAHLWYYEYQASAFIKNGELTLSSLRSGNGPMTATDYTYLREKCAIWFRANGIIAESR